MTIPTALSAGKVTSSLRHVPELDGLRGVAILMVLLFHYSADAPREEFGEEFGGVWTPIRCGGRWVSALSMFSMDNPFDISRGCLHNLVVILVNQKGGHRL